MACFSWDAEKELKLNYTQKWSKLNSSNSIITPWIMDWSWQNSFKFQSLLTPLNREIGLSMAYDPVKYCHSLFSTSASDDICNSCFASLVRLAKFWYRIFLFGQKHKLTASLFFFELELWAFVFSPFEEFDYFLVGETQFHVVAEREHKWATSTH